MRFPCQHSIRQNLQGHPIVPAAGKLAWDNREAVMPALRRIWRTAREWWDGRVLLIGPGGTGKTTLARVLAGEVDWLVSAPWEYTESLNVEKLRMKKGLDAGMVVAPGQRTRRPTWADIHAELAAGKFRGVVFVSAYGHHSLGGGGLKAAFPGVPKAEAVSAHLADGRADELAIFQELTKYMAMCPKKLWLLSVVTKQDLWYNQDAVVRRHYSEGDYAALVSEITAARAGRTFRHEIEFVSLVISNLVTTRGETLAKNLEGYDQRLQVESVRLLFNAVARLIEWEKLR